MSVATTTITSVNHGFKKNQKIFISDSNFFNGKYIVTSVNGDTYTLKEDVQIEFWLIFILNLFFIGIGVSIIYMDFICDWLLNIFG